jgi:hypothetical protein
MSKSKSPLVTKSTLGSKSKNSSSHQTALLTALKAIVREISRGKDLPVDNVVKPLQQVVVAFEQHLRRG